MWGRTSLRSRLVAIGASVLLLALGLVTWSTTLLVSTHLESELQLRSRQLRPLLNSALAVPMAQRDYASVAAILLESQAAPDLVYLRVFDSGGRLIASEGLRPEDAEGGTGRQPQHRDAVNVLPEFTAPLSLGGQTVGEVRFGISRETVDATRRTIISRIVLISLVALAGFSLLLGLISFFITKPLRSLLIASRDIRAGNYDIELDSRRRDEIGTLIGAFITMTREVKRKVSELTQSEALQRQYLRESKHQQTSAEIAFQKAQAATRAKSEFLANMSHEIRTPMNSVLGFSQLLQETELTGQQQDYINKVQTAGSALLHILDDILDYSKIEAGHLEIRAEPFSLKGLVTNVTDLFSFQAQDKGIVLLAEIDPAVPPYLLGDALRVRQILVNLVGNALKFTEHGEVRVAVQLVTDTASAVAVRLSVSDTGIGMTADQLSHIFSAFSQADASITRRFGGTGLGLSICKRLVELMDGALSAESVEAKGSTFSFTLTFQHATEAGAIDVAELSSGARTWGGVRDRRAKARNAVKALRGARVLLVEDNAVNSMVAAAFLTDLGMQVSRATNGLEAVERVAQQSFDVILMDLQMPLMNGFEATRQIIDTLKERAPPIIALTASAMLQDQQACLDAGMRGHLPKPVMREQLTQTLMKWVSNPTAAQSATPPAAPTATTAPSQPAGSAPTPPSLVLVPAVAEVALDPLLQELEEMLRHNRFTAKRMVDKIEALLQDTDMDDAFQPVAQAARKLRFKDALESLRLFRIGSTSSPA